MKGKKFNASERHFQKKELKLNQQIKRLEEWNKELLTKNYRLTEENRKLMTKLTQLQMENKKLIDYSKLSKEDLSNALEKDKSLKIISQFVDLANKY